MALRWKHARQTVRPRSVPKVPWFACLLAFALTSAVVYRWAQGCWIPEMYEPTYTATAYVVDNSNQPAGEIHIPLAYTSGNAKHAEEVANALAEQYVHDRCVEWRRNTVQSLNVAHEATEKARDQYVVYQARLDEFRTHLAKITKPAKSPEPPVIDNPRWLELNGHLAELVQRRQRLLLDRTALHPAVLDISDRIDNLKHQMADVPCNLPSTTGRGGGGEGDAQFISQITTNPQQRLAELTADAVSARKNLDKAVTAERLAAKKHEAEPPFSVVYATTTEVEQLPAEATRQPFWLPMFTGVLMAFGVGSVLFGLKIEPPLASAADAQANVRTAILGTIPAERPASDPSSLSRRKTRRRAALVLAGSALITAAPLLAMLAASCV